MGRRGENIRYRKWDKRWEARVVCGPPVNGKTSYRYIYGKSYREVRLKKQALEKDLETGETAAVTDDIRKKSGIPAEGTTFADAAGDWLKSKKMVLKESSYATYSYLANHYLMPDLGEMPLDSICKKTLENLFARLKNHGRSHGDRPLSDKTIGDIRTILVQILSYGVSSGMIDKVPECPPVPSRKPTAKALEIREQDDIERAALLEGSCFSAAVILLLYTGLRVGEVCGLMWGDIDFDRGILHVDRTVSRIRNTEAKGDAPRTKVVIGSPKTDCSRRIVPLPDEIIRYLAAHRLGSSIYIATGTTKFMEPRAFLAKFKRFLARNRLEDCTVHTLRHSYATQCIKYGVDVKSLSEIMGHANVKITMQLYVHPSMESKKAEVNKLPCKVISGQKSGQPIIEPVEL